MADRQPDRVVPRYIRILRTERIRREMRPHIKARRHDDKRRHRPAHIERRRSARKQQIPRLQRLDLVHQITDAARIMIREIKTEEQHRTAHEHILDHRGRSNALEPAEIHEDCYHHKGNEHRRHAIHRAERSDLDNEPQRGELHLQIRHQKGHADAGQENPQPPAVIKILHQIALCDQKMAVPIDADARQDMIANHIAECAIAQDIKGRPALRIGPAARAQERECRIHLTSHDEPVQPAAEAAPANRPVLRTQAAAHTRNCPEDRRADDKAK